MSSVSLGGTRAGTSRAARARRARPYDGPEPWGRRDALVIAVVLTVAVVGLVIGWLGVSDTVNLDDQTGWLGFGIGALILGGFGMVAWLLAGLRRVAVLRREVLAEVNRRHPEPGRATAALTGRQAPEKLLCGTVTGMRRYHRADCQMLADKEPVFADSATHAQAGLAPCPICTPTESASDSAGDGS